MPRFKDQQWNFPADSLGNMTDRTHMHIALLMDLRDEMKRQNELTERLVNVLECQNALAIPGILRRIDKRLAKAAPLK